MNKRSLATISGLLSFTIGTGLVLIFGVHSPMMSQCSKRSDGSLLAMHMQASPDQSNLIFFPCSFKVFHLVSTGALSWSGRVTGKSRIVIQRSNLNFQILTGTIDTDSQRFTSSMLTAPFPVRLRT